LISEPDILQFEISIEDKYVLLATDGFWDVITNLLYFIMFYLPLATLNVIGVVLLKLVGN
jgi:hypothetical protein